MPEQDLIERVDAAVETLLRRPESAQVPKEAELAPLWRIAADLTLLPNEDFKARLKRDIQARGTMTTMTAAPAEVYKAATPSLTVRDAAAALDFYAKAFGARETMRLTESGRGIGHAEIEIGEARFMLGPEYPEMGILSPDSLGGSPVRIHLNVDDVDALVDRAQAAGAKVLSPPSDQFYGHRSARVQDPFGHTWLFATKKEDLTTAEMQRRLDELMQEAGPAPQTKKVKPTRPGFHSVTPYLVVEKVAPFLDFLKAAFGAEELMRAEGGSAGGTHAEAKIGDSIIMMGGDAPDRAKPYPAVLYLYLPDVDQSYASALKAGATSLTPPADQPYGDRTASVKDPFGNTWYLATHVRDM